MQKPRRQPVVTTKAIAQGNMTVRAIMNTGPMIEDLDDHQRNDHDPHTMNARVMTVTMTGTPLVMMTKDAPRTRTRTKARTIK